MAITDPIGLNTEDRGAIRPIISRRAQAIVANYALYILGEDPGTSNHTNRLSWAEDAIQKVGSVAEQVSWYALNQTSYINGGSSIEDAELSGIIEAAINAHFIAPL